MTDYDSKLSNKGFYSIDKYNPNKRKCICLEDGKIYESCSQAENYYGFKKDSVGRVCRGDRLTIYNKHFDFLDTTEEIQNKKKNMECLKSKSSHSAKLVICVENGKIYNSSAEASISLGMQKGYVSNLIRKNRKTKEGYTFKYI